MSEESLIARSNASWLKRKVRKGPVSKSHPWYSSPSRERKRRREKVMKQLLSGDIGEESPPKE